LIGRFDTLDGDGLEKLTRILVEASG